MALPIDITSTIIVTEALTQAGYPSPSATLITRAKDRWLRGLMERLAKIDKLTPFEETKITIMSPYKQRYALPIDADRVTQLMIYNGETTGIAQGGAASTITLAAIEEITEVKAKGALLFMLSGTSKNQNVRITAYNETTKVATVTPDFDVTVVAADTYLIADRENITEVKEAKDISDDVIIGSLPTKYHIYGRTPKKQILFNSVIKDDEVAAIKCRYLVYPHKIDLTDSRLTSIYNEYFEELVQGVLAVAKRDNRDATMGEEFGRYNQYLNTLKNKNDSEQEGGNIQLTIGDN